MHVWIVTIGEPLPSDGDGVRLLRHGLLAQNLVQAGHEVTWWTSTFDHQRKQQRADEDTVREIEPNYSIQLIKAPGYTRNVSLARIRDHREVARRFTQLAALQSQPDIILCAFPTIELCAECVRFGEQHQVPVVLDIRDMWPDIFYDTLPRSLRGLGPVLAWPMVRQVRFAMRKADYLFAASGAFMDWALDLAGRTRGESDLVFPLAYRRLDVDAGEQEAAGQALRDMGVDPQKKICWFIGTLGRRYDVPSVIEAARHCQNASQSDIQFVISGEGDCSEALHEQAKGLNNLIFTGWVKTPQIAYLMSIADVGLVAINADLPTLPNKMFEYFSADLPVISSVPGEGAELITEKNCGLNYELGNGESLYAAITAIFKDDAVLLQMRANARALFEQRFSHEVVYPKMVALLEDLAVKSSTAHTAQQSV